MGRFVIQGNSFDEENNNAITAPNNLVSCQCSFIGKNNVLKIPSHAKLNNLVIEFLGDDGYCEIDNSPRLSGIIRIGHSSSVIIEKGVTSTNKIYLTCAEGTRVFIGEDCMFATNNQIRTDDAHGIYDVHTGKRVNPARSIHIGKHVWVGFNATILGGGVIGDGSVVGMNSLVKKKFPNNCVIAGNPAKIIKKDIFWERPFLPSAAEIIEFTPEQLTSKSHCNPTQEEGINQ